MLVFPITHCAHALCNRKVLIRYADDSRDALGPLRIAINEVIVRRGSESISITEGEHGARIVKDQLRAGDRVLFKASRKEQLEQIALLIEQQLQVEGAGS